MPMANTESSIPILPDVPCAVRATELHPTTIRFAIMRQKLIGKVLQVKGSPRGITVRETFRRTDDATELVKELEQIYENSICRIYSFFMISL